MKTLQNLSSKECSEVSQISLRNASSQWKAAIVLSKTGNYGLASSILIISIEEYLKGLLVFLESMGFRFLKLSGINQFFKNHQVRYFTAYPLFILYLISEEYMDFFQRFLKNEIDAATLSRRTESNPELYSTKIKILTLRRIITYQREIEWFEKKNELRQTGFYTDYKDGVISPLTVSEQQFRNLHQKLSRVRYVIRSIIKFVESEPSSHPALVKIYEKYDSKAAYAIIERVLLSLRSKEPFTVFRTMLQKNR